MSAIQPYQGSYLLPDPEHASVADVMHRGVISCPPDATLREVAEIMAAHAVHCVVVDGVTLDPVSGERLVWGLVTDLDLVNTLGRGHEPVTAARIAVTDVVTVSPEDSLVDAARLMEEHRLGHLLVTSERTGRPVGVVSTLDIARAMAWGGER